MSLSVIGEDGIAISFYLIEARVLVTNNMPEMEIFVFIWRRVSVSLSL